MTAGPHIYRRRNDGRLQIGKGVAELLLTFRQLDHKDHESGGVLLGRHIAGTDDIIVDSITTPQTGDKGGRRFFHRARKRHQELIDAAWQESHGTVTYLGEWHTHPEELPTPSAIDHFGWAKKRFFDEFSDVIFFMIVGTKQIRVWEGRRRCAHVAQLRKVDGVDY